MQYETYGDIETFAHFLISILDTPEKINLLTEVRYVQLLILVKIMYLKYYCRSVLSPSDIVHFDQIVSRQEVKVLQHAHSSDTDEENSDEGICRIFPFTILLLILPYIVYFSFQILTKHRIIKWC